MGMCLTLRFLISLEISWMQLYKSIETKISQETAISAAESEELGCSNWKRKRTPDEGARKVLIQMA